MNSIHTVFTHFVEALSRLYERPEAEKVTLLVFEHVLNYKRIDITMHKDEVIESAEESELKRILGELKLGRPVQYVLGYAWFYNMKFLVSEDVLIPRPETEELVEWVLNDLKGCSLNPNTIVDWCTGSGCIALALKNNLKDTTVYAVDNSIAALETAESNAKNLELNIELIDANALKISLDITPGLVISNPPYVRRSEKKLMHSRVVDFEPHAALFVPDNDPLIFYQKISDWAMEKMHSGGKLYFEVNEAFGEKVVELLNDQGYKKVILRKDLQGKDRMVKAEKS